jgi:hypothetical protein
MPARARYAADHRANLAVADSVRFSLVVDDTGTQRPNAAEHRPTGWAAPS